MSNDSFVILDSIWNSHDKAETLQNKFLENLCSYFKGIPSERYFCPYVGSLTKLVNAYGT